MGEESNLIKHYVVSFNKKGFFNTKGNLIFLLQQGGAGHLGSPEQGKRAKIFLGKGLFGAQNRATKTRCEGVFRCRGTLKQ